MNELLKLALNAHGGLENWGKVKSLDLRLTVSGELFPLKGNPDGVKDAFVRINTKTPEVMISPFPKSGYKGFFTTNRVWIEDTNGKIIEARDNPGATFYEVPFEKPWDNLYLLYFVGYALWGNLNSPFLLTRPGFELKELEPHNENGELWRPLQVKFPADIPTHSALEQTFFFNEKGILQRTDYTAVSAVSHYWFDPKTFNGFVFPTLHRAVGREQGRPMLSSPTAVMLQIADVIIN